MLSENSDEIIRKVGVPFEVTKIGVRDPQKVRPVNGDLITTDLQSIIDDPEIEVILELMGGEDTAADCIESALRKGKHVVTANKELIAKQGSRLITLAQEVGKDLHFEAAVGGGIPIVQPLKHQLAGNDIVKMMGILNGTTNFILTKMHQENADFSEVLQEAQDLGYAEADPTSDVEGFDTKYKIGILAAIAFGRQVPLENIHTEGITKISDRDMHYAGVFGYRIKLLGICEEIEPDKILVRVHPTLVPKDHPVSKVEDVYNALWIHGDFVGDLMFTGRGAGSDPTASAVVGDLIDCGRDMMAKGTGSAIPFGVGMQCASISDLNTRYFIRLIVTDKPNTLGQIASTFGDSGVGLAAMEMRTLEADQGEIAFLTHECKESDFVSALKNVEGLEVVNSVENWLRVED